MVYTSLHCHILEKRYDEVRNDLLSEQINDMVRSRHNKDLPLHLALLNGAPDQLVIDIFKAFPGAANVPSSTGKTAIEIAKEKKSPTDAVLKIMCLDYVHCNAHVPTRDEPARASSRTSAPAKKEKWRSRFQKSLSRGDSYRSEEESSSSSSRCLVFAHDTSRQYCHENASPKKADDLKHLLQKSLSKAHLYRSSSNLESPN
mmetsp:Transcript_6120/g.8898  ORF Transcript_6120/g.8898 Transcript_6120/m.8898 type:complete len:202 (-) Transcript_6120:290-895(-)